MEAVHSSKMLINNPKKKMTPLDMVSKEVKKEVREIAILS
jgi:hypothetical protein